MKLKTRIRARLLGWIGIFIVLVLPAGLLAAYIGAFNATSFEERMLLWQVTVGLALLVPIGPLLILFGIEWVSEPDPEAAAAIHNIVQSLDLANQQGHALQASLADVQAVAEHFRERIEQTRG